MGIWPAILVTGATFALSQFLVSNYIGPELVDVIAAIALIVALVAFLKVWQSKTIWTSASLTGRGTTAGTISCRWKQLALPRAWLKVRRAARPSR